MVFFLAIRNIIKNKKDNSIVALLIAVIAFLFFIGNSFITEADRNIRQAYIESLTGDVVLQKSGDVTMNLYGANTPVIDSFFTIPVLPAYDTVMELISAEAGIEGISSQVSGRAYMDILDAREQVLLCGVDAASYFSLFPGIQVVEGEVLQAGKYGAMITVERAQRIRRQTGQRPAIGMPLLFTSGGTVGFKIREVPLVGIFRYQNPGEFMNEIVIIDPQTARVLNSIQVASAMEEGSLNLPGDDLDDIFGDTFPVLTEVDNTEFSADLLRVLLSELETDAGAVEAGGGWNFILLRLKNGTNTAGFIASLNKKIEPYGVTAVNWRTASGTSSILRLLIQALFNAGIFLVSVVGVIAVVNILLISVFRRVREIGTLRAIGASDFYIRSLIYLENVLVALFAGIAGIAAGYLFLWLINGMALPISNELVASVLNRTSLWLDFLPDVAVFSFGVAVLLGLAATVYPVETAVRIKPVVAMQRG